MMDRRFFLRSLGALGCSAAAHPLMTTMTLAQSAGTGDNPLGDHRLVVIILRGAMDGLDVVRPVEDPLYARLRPTLGLKGDAPMLSQGFALHPRLSGLMPLWTRGHLAFAHAVSTPYRDKRSHFDGQDMLEAGTGMDVPLSQVHDGWMNRMLQAVPGIESETAFAVGRDALPLLQGKAPSASWTPQAQLDISSQSRLLLEHVWHDDPVFRDSGLEAMALAAETSALEADEDEEAQAKMAAGEGRREPEPRGPAGNDALVDFAVQRLKGPTRIVAFSQTGWDTHRAQERGINDPLDRLQATLLRLADGLGPEIWDKTLLLAMTEFGRTAAENGTAGTDHGTGGVMLMAGGALKGGKIYGRFPGLAEDQLYDRRDLMPTSDVRAWAAWAMAGLYGFDRGTLEKAVFPGLDMGQDPGFLA